eukprot:7218334-Karenia_brevis.AAC.1
MGGQWKRMLSASKEQLQLTGRVGSGRAWRNCLMRCSGYACSWCDQLQRSNLTVVDEMQWLRL